MNKLKNTLVSFLIRFAIEFIGCTCKIRLVQGEEILKNAVSQKKPVIFSFWHNRIFFTSYFLLNNSHKKGLKISVLISKSKDGEFISRVVEAWKGRSVRGSSSKGGYGAIKGLLKSIHDGYALVVTPDGPRGPVYKYQSGSLYLSSIAQIPIIPLSCAFEKAIILNSWDKFIIPKPFSKVNVSIGEPIQIEKKVDTQSIEKYQKMLEDKLIKLNPQFND